MADTKAPPDIPLSPPIESVRSTAKWYLAGFAAVGAAVLTAIGLKSPNPDSENLFWVLAAVAAAFLALAWMLSGVARLLLPEDVTLAEALQDTAVRTELEKNREILAPYARMEDLTGDRTADQNAYTGAWNAWHASPTVETANVLKLARLKLGLSTPIIDRVLSWATFYTVQAHYNGQMRFRVLPGLLVATGALIAYVLLNTAPDAAPSFGETDLHGRDLSGLVLNGFSLKSANLRGANLSQTELIDADLSGTVLVGADLSGANLSGAKLANAKLDNATLASTTCPDGTISSAQQPETCEGHMTPNADEQEEQE